jgi:tetratricopeptide (TPR) repeat protein
MNLAMAELKVGQTEAALVRLEDLCLHHWGDMELNGRAETLTACATGNRLLGRHDRALDYATQAVNASAAADPFPRAEALYALGHVHHALGQPDRARDVWQESVTILEAIHHVSALQRRAELEARFRSDVRQTFGFRSLPANTWSSQMERMPIKICPRVGPPRQRWRGARHGPASGP